MAYYKYVPKVAPIEMPFLGPKLRFSISIGAKSGPWHISLKIGVTPHSLPKNKDYNKMNPTPIGAKSGPWI